MANSPILDAWRREIAKAGLPANAITKAAEILCAVLHHQFYMRDTSHGDLYRMIESLKARISKLEDGHLENQNPQTSE